MNWIKVSDEAVPLEVPVLVSHKYGVDAIQFWGGKWKYWYSGAVVGTDLLETVTHWCLPIKQNN